MKALFWAARFQEIRAGLLPLPPLQKSVIYSLDHVPVSNSLAHRPVTCYGWARPASSAVFSPAACCSTGFTVLAYLAR